MFNLDVVPNYGPTRMSDELILLTRDAVAWHNNDAASKVGERRRTRHFLHVVLIVPVSREGTSVEKLEK